MKRGFICILVLGLANISLGIDDNVVSESKEASSRILGNTYTQSKRGVVKLTNADNPAFNHLSSSSSSSSSGGFKPSTPISSNPPPFKYLYSNQYYQPNPFVTYVQIPQATQIAAQYAFQTNPVAHYLQTPTQIQYVAAPTVAQVPQYKYPEYSTASNTADGSSSGATSTLTQYVPTGQQTQSYVSSGASASQTSASTATSTSTTSQNKQVETPIYSGYQTAQPFYYQQQPFYTYFTQPQVSPTNFIYQQPNYAALLKQQQLLNFYGGNRFGLYPTTHTTQQLTYLVPMAVTPSVQETSTTDKTSEKASTTSQYTSSSSNSFTFGTKA